MAINVKFTFRFNVGHRVNLDTGNSIYYRWLLHDFKLVSKGSNPITYQEYLMHSMIESLTTHLYFAFLENNRLI